MQTSIVLSVLGTLSVALEDFFQFGARATAMKTCVMIIDKEFWCGALLCWYSGRHTVHRSIMNRMYRCSIYEHSAGLDQTRKSWCFEINQFSSVQGMVLVLWNVLKSRWCSKPLSDKSGFPGELSYLWGRFAPSSFEASHLSMYNTACATCRNTVHCCRMLPSRLKKQSLLRTRDT